MKRHKYAPQIISSMAVLGLCCAVGLGCRAGDKSGDTPPASAAAPAGDEATTIYATKVEPIITQNCIRCHGPGRSADGLRLDSREAILKGGQQGPAAVVGDPDHSLIVHMIRPDQGYRPMPPRSQLSDADKATIARWIKIGMPWGPAKS